MRAQLSAHRCMHGPREALSHIPQPPTLVLPDGRPRTFSTFLSPGRWSKPDGAAYIIGVHSSLTPWGATRPSRYQWQTSLQDLWGLKRDERPYEKVYVCITNPITYLPSPIHQCRYLPPSKPTPYRHVKRNPSAHYQMPLELQRQLRHDFSVENQTEHNCCRRKPTFMKDNPTVNLPHTFFYTLLFHGNHLARTPYKKKELIF